MPHDFLVYKLVSNGRKKILYSSLRTLNLRLAKQVVLFRHSVFNVVISKAPSTRIQIFLNPQLFLSGFNKGTVDVVVM